MVVSITSLWSITGFAQIDRTVLPIQLPKHKPITANLELEGNDRGIILCQGGKFGGWALYMDDGQFAYTYNWVALKSYTIKSSTTLPKGTAEVKLDFVYDGGGFGKGGLATLYIGIKKVGEGRIGNTIPFLFSADETADVEKDEATQVANTVFKDVHDSEFTDYVKKKRGSRDP
jgi:arylsulfatase